MIVISQDQEGCYLSIHAQPGARKAGIGGERAGALRVAVTAPPEKGRANKAILQVLADALDLKRSQLELVAGETSRQKRVLIRGLNKPQLERLLAPYLDTHDSQRK